MTPKSGLHAQFRQSSLPPTRRGNREAFLAREELLHGGLFEVALLGDEPVQPAEQPIHIAQRLRDGALFGRGGTGKRNRPNLSEI